MSKILLKEICSIEKGYEPGSSTYSQKEGTKFFRVSDLSTNGAKAIFSNSEKLILVNEDDVLMSLDGSPGIVATGFNGAISSGIRVFRGENNLDNRYLYWYLKSNYVQNIIKKNSVGAIIKHAGKSIEKFKIEVIDINIQKKIAKKLDKIDNAINNRRKVICELDNLIESKFNEMFGNPFVNDKKYSTMKFKDFCNSIIRGPFGSDMKKSLFVPKSDGNYKVYIQENILRANQSAGNYYITEKYFDEKMSRFEVKEKDFIITCDGTLGKIYQLKNPIEPGVISSSLLKITLNDSIVDNVFFENIWNLFLANDLIKKNTNACLPHMPSVKIISEYNVIMPSLKEQKNFNKFVKKVVIQKELIQQDIKDLESLLETKIHKYFD